MWKSAMIGLAAVALLATGCTNGSKQLATPKDVVPADVQACHDFGSQIIHHGSTISDQTILNVVTELESASNSDLRREATNLRGVINGDSAARLKYYDRIAQTCYSLHLLNSSGAPI